MNSRPTDNIDTDNMSLYSASNISSTIPLSTVFTPIIKKQQWNPKVMASIWAKRDTLDVQQLAHIKALYDNAKRHNRYDISTFTYSHSNKSSISRMGYGRLYSKEKGSLEKIEKTLRQSLCAGIYWDVDIVNAQPTILSQMAEKRDIKLNFLSYYVSNRESLLNHCMKLYSMTRDDVKEWIIKCMFGSNIPELDCLQKELKQLSNQLRGEYEVLYEHIVKQKESNIVGTFLAYVAQTEECRCLLLMNDFFTDKDRSVDVLCYDGCMIRVIDNEKEFPVELLRECEEYILKVTGYKIKLDIKPLVCSPDFSGNTKLIRKENIDDVFMANKFINHMKNNLIRDSNNDIMVFDSDKGLWSSNIDDLREAIINANLIEETIDGSVNYSGFVYKQDAIIKMLPAMLPSLNFCENTVDKGIAKLLLKDGLYDMKTKSFTNEYDRDIYFTGKIDRSYSERNEELIKEVDKLLFQDPFKGTEQDVGVYLKQLLARGIAGHYYDKTLIIAIGESNAGKGVLSIALEKTFNSYISSFNPNVFHYNKNSSQDEAKKLAWVYSIHNSRIAIGNEAKPIGVLDSGIIKSICSGGDLIPIRKNFMDEENKRNRSTPILFCNDLPPFYPLETAITNRVKVIEYKLTFVEKKENEVLEQWERRANPNIKNLFDSQEYQDAFFWCIMDSYCEQRPVPPSTSLMSANEWVPAPKKTFIDALNDAGFQIVKGNEDAYVPFSDIKAALKEQGVCNGMSDQAIGRELNKLGLNIDEKRIDGKVTKIRKFIMKI